MRNATLRGAVVAVLAALCSVGSALEPAAATDPNGPPPIPTCSRPIWPDTNRPLVPSSRVDAITVEGVRINVLVPPRYRDSRRRYPVLFLLHGGGQWQDLYLTHTDLESFTSGLPDDQQAIVVMPDAAFGIYQDTRDGSPSWERFHLYTVLPFIDAHYRTIADRSHRAITGESGGGLGTMDYAARHPDLFVAASSMSGAVDIGPTGGYPVAGSTLYAASVAIGRGCNDSGDDGSRVWGGPVDYELWQRNENPTDLAVNLRGMSLRVASGNGVPCDAADANDYHELFPILEPVAAIQADHFTRALANADVPYAGEFPSCGLHSFRYFQRFLHDFWPQMVAAFGTESPAAFDYRRADSRFSVWGWDFVADPGRAGEFLDIRDASCAGLTLRGSGLETVTTRSCFTAGQRVRIDDGRRTATLRADKAGRLTFAIDLGSAHPYQQYTAGGRAAEAAAGDRYWITGRVALSPLSPRARLR